MEQVMPDFITYLTNERNASKSTVSSYCRDLERMFQSKEKYFSAVPMR